MIHQNKVILITGTPCTGKTTVADKLNNILSEKYTSKLIKINEFAIKNDLIDGEDIEKGYKIINLSKLDKKLNKMINRFFSCNESITNKYNTYSNNNDIDGVMNNNSNDCNSKIVIIEGHLSHFCSLDGKINKVIVLRLNPDLLEKRLKLRDYDNNKIHENLESEALGVCSVEAYENHGNKVNEIDTTNLSIETILTIIKDIIYNKKEFPIGDVDFINWIID
ncbi:putative adenylate kinase [Candidatus Methanobinarius endosymbioticus]|uniref:Putative adenylate kinase n=1 Tax=Candidatus Methanobinarius endosymbioticus TaxID=2006182 RepID=A0A366M9C7_9EURY|nr:putative adenylate kinase [Candidatus Methanobinarius endosymbioticus]